MYDLKQLSIMLVEDENDLRIETTAFLELYFSRVIAAANGKEALDIFSRQRPDLVLSDIRMPHMDGLELAARLKELSPLTPVIFSTAFTETAYLLKAIELGVAAYVRKPVDTDELLAALHKAALPLIQSREIRNLTEELDASLCAQLGVGSAFHVISAQILRVAPTTFNVLLQGETGSGKSYLAGLIHALSPRRNNPFIAVQLAAMPEQLLESELFGHIKGAFTGASQNRAGLVETAEGGTLLLDDIDTCPPVIQAKLLRFVEEKRFLPLGSSTEKTGDVRIISATNRNLQKEVADRRFREDLYYRLSDVIISLPPLRKTRDAIIPLAVKFLQETCDALGRAIPALDDEARIRLASSSWPGNIRQLKSVIRRAALSADHTISAAIIGEVEDAFEQIDRSPKSANACFPPPFPCKMEALEKWALMQALDFCGGQRMKTAAMLGMNYYTFRRKLEKHGIATDSISGNNV